MGTGVGEAMLIGAVTGAGTSALTGNDPLKGALLGAAGGGIGAGVGGALAGGTSGAATGATTGAVGGTGLTAGAAGTSGLTAGTVGGGTGGAAGGVGGTTGTIGGQYALTSGAGGMGGVGGSGITLGGGTSGAAGGVGGAGSQYALTGGIPATDYALASGTGSPFAMTAGSQAASSPMKFMDVFKGDTGTVGSRLGTYMQENPKTTAATGAVLANMMGQRPPGIPGPETYDGPLSRFRYDPDRYRPAFAGGGIADLPAAMQYRRGGDLGMHSDGGRMTKDRSGGDGMSDEIPAMIGEDQPARLADGEFVIPADVVSHLGNGSTDAGARQLYAMMDRVRKARTGNEKQGKEINPRKMMPV